MSRFIEGVPPGAGAVSAPAASAGRTRAVERVEEPVRTSFSDVLRALGQRVDKGERVVQHALHSDMGGLDARALIAVQAGIYHYTEAIELAGKLIDRATSAVKTVLQPGGH
jgi:hypothetical protein